MGKGAQTFLCTNIGKFTKVAHTHTCKTYSHTFNNNYLQCTCTKYLCSILNIHIKYR